MTRDRGPRPSPGSAATSLLTRGHAFIRVFHSDSWLQEVSRPQARGEPPRRAPALQARCGDVVPPATPAVSREPAPVLPGAPAARGQRCVPGGVCPPAPAPDAPLSSAGYAPSDMPVKAKRSTYNYSLPITVKKTRTCLGPLRAGAAGLAPTPRAAGGRAAPRGATQGAAGQRAPWRGRGGASGGTLCIPRRCPVPHSQPARLHARPETGPGPTGHSWHTEVGLQQVQAQGGCPQSPRGAAAHRAEGGVGRAPLAWGWYTHCTHGAPPL